MKLYNYAMKKYKYRHRETYKGIRIDLVSNSAEDLAEKIRAKKSRIDRQSMDTDTSLIDFGLKYIDTYKSDCSEKWQDGLKWILKKHIAKIGNKKISTIKPIEIQTMLNGCNYSSNFVGKIYNLTCQIFHYAYKNGLTPYDYSQDLTRPKGRPTQAGRSLTAEEQLALLSALSGHRAELLCKLMYYCGLRVKEARELIWAHIDLSNATIHIYGTKTANADRTIPIPQALLPLLKEKYASPFEKVCPFDEQSARRAWSSIKREMNILMGCKVYRNQLIPPYPVQEPCRLYDLRHTYCTNLEKQGVPISIASRLMGHSDISITAKIYTHESAEAIEIARQLIDRKSNAV